MEFTTQSVAGLTLDTGKTDQIFFDDSFPGFGLRLRTGGKRTWILQYRNQVGRSKRITIADARRVVLKAARASAEKRFAEITLGRDPQAERDDARARAAILIGPLVERYLTVKEGILRPNSMTADRRYLERYWRPLHRSPVEQVTRRHVAARLGEIVSEHGSTAAARARQSLSAFFSWLIREGIADVNPVIGTSDPAEHLQARDRVLSDKEIVAVWSGLRDDDFGRIVKLLFMTAARRDEIGGLTWKEIEGGVLLIKGARTKNRHDLRLTLPEAAQSVVDKCPRRDGREFVFGVRGGPFSRWSWEKLSLDNRVLARGVAVAPWTLHDIRRTAATGMAEIGIQPHIIEAVLNHRGGHKAGVAGIYNRATYEREMAQALARWADHLSALISGTQPNILPLARSA